jgi:ankyrin repeat protein
MTALNFAADRGSTDIAKSLISAGASLTITDNPNPPLLIAVKKGNTEIAK